MRKMPNDVEKLDRISSAMDADKQGNVEVGKNLKIDGNLQFKSLISDDNPDGTFDPTGSGGGTANKLYKHTIHFWSSSYGSIYLTIYNTSIEQIDSESKLKAAITNFGSAIASGYIKNGNTYFTVYYVYRNTADNKVKAVGYQYNTQGDLSSTSTILDYHFSTMEDDVKQVR